MAKKKSKIIIIDAMALIFRSYYALPPLSTKKGLVVNAVYGFFNTLFNVIRDYNPNYLCIAFDEEKPTFRKKMYSEYKAQRETPPDDFKPQIPIIIEILDLLKIKRYSKPGFEADDVIGSICAQKSIDNKDTISYILTGDLDTLQLVDDNTKVITFKRGITETTEYDEKSVQEKYGGLTPKQLVDMKALKGDASDNIPGVKGIGEKGAIQLIKEFGSLENLYQNINSPKIKERQRKLLLANKEMAFLSKKLVTIITDLDIDFNLEETKLQPYPKEKVAQKFKELDFKSILNKLPDIGEKKKLHQEPQEIEEKKEHSYTLINKTQDFQKFLNKLKKQKEFTFDIETTSLDPFSCEILGLAFSWAKGEAYYLSLLDKQGDGLFEGSIVNPEWLNQLKPILQNNQIKKIGHNLKYDIEVLKQQNIDVQGVTFDTMIAAYLLSSDDRSFSLDNLVYRELGHEMIKFEDLVGTGQKQIKIENVPINKLSYYACEDADYTHRLYKKLKKEIKDKGMNNLFNNIEMPLVKVLAIMETNGVLVDEKTLKKLSNKTGKELQRLEEKIYQLAGQKFNIASPNQLQEILFDKLHLPVQGIAKTKTGYSTAASELSKLKDEHEIIPLLIEYRELSKFQSTYLEALPKLINPKTGRIHTSYNQTVATTGRLSSTNPNLQNIPIRSEFGRLIRNAFIAPQGFKIVAADYSQIELRIAAHYSGDKNMIKIFKEGKDIHTSTAAKIHKIKEEEVTKEIRSTAKEVNFGIIYGLGPFGLAQRTDLNRQEAKDFIKTYFQTFPGIKEYIDKTIEQARQKGYAETLFGRRRYLPNLLSSNKMMQSAAERIAINMPLQGTAADLIKIAMIKIQNSLPQISPETKMIMQVHDELVFEVPDKDVAKVSEFVKNTMENAHKFKVPIVVDIAVGNNWGEAK